MEDMLHDQDTYINIKKNLLINLLTLHALYLQGGQRTIILQPIYKKVFCSDGILPKAYGLPKIHKSGNSFRIIISSIDIFSLFILWPLIYMKLSLTIFQNPSITSTIISSL